MGSEMCIRDRITGARFLNYNRSSAIKISMLMSIPTIIAAATLEFYSLGFENISINWLEIVLAIIISALAAFGALSLMMRLLTTINFTPYVLYRILLGSFLIIWAVIFLIMSFYLFGSYFGKLKFNYKSYSGWFFLLFTMYLISGLFESKNVRLLSGILPPEFYSIKENNNNCPLGLNCFKEYESGKEFAIQNDKIILLDFTGWACANCRRMEENVWSKPAIFDMLDSKFVIISLYVDDRSKLSEEDEFKYLNKSGNIQYINNVGRRWSLFQQINFSNASQPYYVAMMPSGRILTEPIQYASEENFEKWLISSIDESIK